MTTKPDTADNGQAALTAGELAALEAVRNADARKPETWVNDRIASEQIWASLDEKNLVFWDKPDCIITITKRGESVLAAQAASEPKPTTITASKFVDDGYGAKLHRGDCFIYYEGDRIYGLYEVLVDIHGNTSYVFDFGTHEESGLMYLDADDKLDISWIEIPLPSAPVPVPAGGEVSDEVMLRLQLATYDDLFCKVHPDSTDAEWKPFMEAQDKLYDQPDEKYHMLLDLLDASRARIAALEAERKAAGLLVTALADIAEGAADGKPILSEYGTLESYRDGYIRWEIGKQAKQALSAYERRLRWRG